jgi:hypothetical protein
MYFVILDNLFGVVLKVGEKIRVNVRVAGSFSWLHTRPLLHCADRFFFSLRGRDRKRIRAIDRGGAVKDVPMVSCRIRSRVFVLY